MNFVCRSCRVFSHFARNSIPRSILSAGYKSQYSIDQLYPNSNPDLSSNSVFKHTDAEKFSGFIPTEDLDIRYSKSSGPGGQHVNKVNSKVEVRFHLESASWIPEWIKPQLQENERNRISKDGHLIVWSEKTRKQMLNQADCLEKIRSMVFRAAQTPYEPTEEELETLQRRKEKAKKAIRREKRHHGLKKLSRQKPTIHDV